MLARLQQGLALAWLLACLLWPASLWQQQRPVAAVAAQLTLLFVHALWLGITHVAAWWSNRGDAGAQASGREWLRAWWGECLTAPRVFFWRQPFAHRRQPDRLVPAPGQPGVLLLHGYFCNRGLWNPWLERLNAHQVPCVALSLSPVFGSIDDMLAPVEAAVRELEAATGVPPLIVAHSMGGLVARAWLRLQPGHARRVRAVMTIGTPHGGTGLARLAFSRNGVQMQRGGAWLQALAASEGPALAARFHCLYGLCDNIVFPARTAVLPGAAEVVALRGVAHVDLVETPQAWAMAWRLLGRSPADQG